MEDGLVFYEREEEGIEEETSKIFVDLASLQGLKEVSQKFLEVNNFDLSHEPLVEDMKEEEFLRFIEKGVSEEVSEKISELGITETLRNNMSQVYNHKRKKTRIFIYFLDKQGSVGLDSYKEFSKLLVKLNCNEGVLVSENPLTSPAMNSLKGANIPSSLENVYNLISYTDDEFIDLTSHCLTPEVLEIYREDEVEIFLKKYNLKLSQLPRMTVEDPICKFYRGKVGNIFKMKRKTGTQGTMIDEQITFRVVVHVSQKPKK